MAYFLFFVSGTKNFLSRIVIDCYSLFCYEHEKPYVPKLRGVVGPVPSLSATSCDAVAKHASHIGSADVYGHKALVILYDHPLNIYLILLEEKKLL